MRTGGECCPSPGLRPPSPRFAGLPRGSVLSLERHPHPTPPLRERKDDIPILAQHFAALFSAEYNKHPKKFTPAALKALQDAAWRGNVRELRNMIERLVIMIPSDTIDIGDLPAEFFRAATEIISTAMRLATLQDFKDEAEKAFIVAKLREHGWNVSKTAEAIDTPRSNLYKKIEQYNIKRERISRAGDRVLGAGDAVVWKVLECCRAKKLYGKARALLDSGAYEEALAIGAKLRRLHYSGAFEIEALAYSALDRDEDAVRVLREGLELAPSVWLNWHLLGNCLSNLHRLDEAMSAYDRAEACPKVDLAIVNLNRAIVAARRQDHAAALRYLERELPDTPQTRLRAGSMRVAALHGLGRDAEAEELGSRILAEWRDAPPNADFADVVFELADIRRERGEDRQMLRAWVVETWRATGHERLLWLIRELRLRRSPDSQYFRLLLHGKTASGGGFYRSVDVVADSPEQALAFLLEIDPAEPDVELTIEEATALEPRPNDPQGLYAGSVRVYYEES